MKINVSQGTVSHPLSPFTSDTGSDVVTLGKVQGYEALSTGHWKTAEQRHKHLILVGLLLFLENEQYSLLTSQNAFLTKLKEECRTLARKLEKISQKSR